MLSRYWYMYRKLLGLRGEAIWFRLTNHSEKGLRIYKVIGVVVFALIGINANWLTEDPQRFMSMLGAFVVLAGGYKFWNVRKHNPYRQMVRRQAAARKTFRVTTKVLK